MKCPYRTFEVEQINEDLTDDDGYIIPNASVKHEFYEECYGTECPFYDNATGLRSKTCKRVIKELQ